MGTHYPSVAIHFSDDGEKWTEAGRQHPHPGWNQARGFNKGDMFHFPHSGAHKFWRMYLTGEAYSNGGWFYMLQWYTRDEVAGSKCNPNKKPTFEQLRLLNTGIGKVDLSDAVCNAHAYKYKPATANGCPKASSELEWKKWLDFRGRRGFFEVTLPDATVVVSAKYQTSNSYPLSMAVYAVDENGPQLVTATPVVQQEGTAKKYRMSWAAVGAFKTWRFELKDQSNPLTGGLFNWEFEKLEADCVYDQLETTTSTTSFVVTEWVPNYPTHVLPVCASNWNVRQLMTADDMEECFCHAPRCDLSKISKCDTTSSSLHWDQWWQNDDQAGHYTTKFKTPKNLVQFTAKISRSPGFRIRYSDDGDTWEDAARGSSGKNVNVTWDEVGAHQFWRYQLDGDWSGGPWYNNLNWYEQSVDPECKMAPQAVCAPPYDMVYSEFTKATHNLGDPDDPYIRWEKVFSRGGQYVDLMLVPSGVNTWKGKKKVMRRNVAILSMERDTRFEAEFHLVQHGTRTPVVVDSFLFSVLDIDRAKDGTVQSFCAEGFDKHYLEEPTEILVSTNNCDQKCFTATGVHAGENNPDDLRNLTHLQGMGVVNLRYTQVSKFKMTFDITKGEKIKTRNFMFAGATSLACPANRTTTTTTPPVPEKCIGNEELEKPDGWEGNDKWYDQCSSWRDPHFTRTFYADKADGSFDALREGLFNLVKLKDQSMHIQGFLCDSGGGTTAWAGFAMKIRKNLITWVRKPNTTVEGCATGIACIPDGMVARDAWTMKINGKKIEYDQLPTWTEGYGNWIIQDKTSRSFGTGTLNSGFKYPDSGPVCIGDYDRKNFVIGTGIQIRSNKEILPSMHIEVAKSLAAPIGLCGSSADRFPISSAESIFPSTDLGHLCHMCGMVSDTLGNCAPAEYHASSSPEQACSKVGVNFEEAKTKCRSSLAGMTTNTDAWVDACVYEYCVTNGDETEIEAAMEESDEEEQEDR